MKVEDIIARNMTDLFGENNFILENKSHLHAGHSGDDGSGQTHFKLTLDKNICPELSKIELHKKIYNNLSEAFSGGLHALEISLKTIQL